MTVRPRGWTMLGLVLAALAVPAAATSRTSASSAVLGIDRNGPHSRLAWFDAGTMRMRAGTKAALGWHVGSWSFSPDRSMLAIAASGDVDLRLVDVRRMRNAGDLQLAPGGRSVGGVAWVRRDRLLAFVGRPRDTTLVVVDAARRKVLRRVVLGRPVAAAAKLDSGLVLLLQPVDDVGPAQLAVVDADGAVRRTTLGRIAIGLRLEGEGYVEARTAGLAVDPAGTAYVVGAESTARIDLSTLDVVYETPQRQLAKALNGLSRSARWLGNGLVAVSGADTTLTTDAAGHPSTDSTPFGLNLLDVRGWSMRTIDPAASSFLTAPGLVLARHDDAAVAYGLDGRERFRIDTNARRWLNVSGRYASVCSQRTLAGVVDLATGRERAATAGARCADLLAGRWSDW